MKIPAEIIIKSIENLVNDSIQKSALKISKKLVHSRQKNRIPKNGGVPIVLTASAIEMSDFNLNPFVAFSGGFPLGIIPKIYLRKKLYPKTPTKKDGTAKFAPYGLRKVEALLAGEFGEKNVVTAYPDNLHEFIGPGTKVVGISTMDPLGIGFVSRTYTSILGLNGKPETLIEFENLLANPALIKYKPKIIVGGSGAWQISSAKMQDELRIDTILIGQAEHFVVEIFKKMMNGEKLERVINMEAPKDDETPTIKKPSLYGTVEITRGCNRGCAFCSPTMRGRYSLPLEHILEEVELNAKSGTKAILLQTDDLFMYKSRENFIPNREAVVELIENVNEVEGVEYIQIAHAALAPIVYDKRIVEEIAPMLVEKSIWNYNGNRYASVEVGIETGSARLMKKYMRRKMLPYQPDEWQEIVAQSIGVLNDNNIYPLSTLILGLPGEQSEDILATIELLDKLKGTKVFYVPLLFTSEEESVLKRRKHKDLKDLDELQWDVFSICWRHNIDVWKPEINKIVKLSSLLLYPYYRWKHGEKLSKPIMKFSGLERVKRGELNVLDSNRKSY